jgi:hypothetical protein
MLEFFPLRLATGQAAVEEFERERERERERVDSTGNLVFCEHMMGIMLVLSGNVYSL